MRSRTRFTAALAAVTITVGAGIAALAGPAQAKQTPTPITCGRQQLIVLTNTNNSSQNGGWGAAQIVVGPNGHLVPTAFNGSLTDDATGQVVFTFNQVKGGGNANQNQQTIGCTVTQTGTLEDFFAPGEPLPPGASLSDPVTFTIDVTAVPHF
jgi:hypothetical protein